MTSLETIHILDSDVRRRAAVARMLLSFGVHAEVYEGLRELESRPPRTGLLLIFDEKMGPSATELVRAVEGTGSYVPVAMYSDQISPERIVSAMLSGALDYLSWPIQPAALRRSLARIGSSNKALISKRRKEAEARDLVEMLSGRELEVLRALVNGASNKDMAKVFGISPRTVEIHRGNMMKKLRTSTTAAAVRIGLFAGVGA